MTKRKNKSYTTEFKQEAVALVTEQGYSVSEATASLGITTKLIYNYEDPEDIMLFQLDSDPAEEQNVDPQSIEMNVSTIITPLVVPKADSSLCFDVENETTQVRNQLKALGYIQ